MLKYNRKTRCTLEGHSKSLSVILGGIKNICIGQGHNNVHISSMKALDISNPIRFRSRPYRLNVPILRYFKNKYLSIYYESDIEETIPMSTMVKRSKFIKTIGRSR